MEKIIIIGASGHGKVIADIAIKNKYNIVGFLDDDPNKSEILKIPVLGKIEDIIKYKDDCKFVIAIGDNFLRKKIYEKYKGVKWATLIHPTAIIAMSVDIGEGTVIMASAVVNTDVKVGKHSIINTGAIVEHDNMIGDFVHISPNVSLGGTVHVGSTTHIGIGVTVKNNLIICEGCILGAGCVIVKDINESGVYYGFPPRRMK